MSIIYKMARTSEGLPGSPFTGQSLDGLAACFTDAPGPEYDGPYPTPGQTLQGSILARDPRKATALPKAIRISVWVTATVADLTDPLLNRDQVADLLNVAPETVSQYRTRRDFPEPDRKFGRSPAWRASTITAWRQQRPGRGSGGGRPRKTTTEE